MIRLKDYFSPSQYALWKSSKRQYYKRYSLGEESKPNKFFNKGKEIGSYLQLINENPDVDKKTLAESISSDPLLFQLSKSVPTLDVMEDKLEVVCGGHKLLGYVDSANLLNTKFLEYKSGKVDPKGNDAWTQEKVDEADQLIFYAFMYWLKSDRKEIPSCELIWIETEEVDVEDEIGNFSHTQLQFTGRVEKFTRNFLVSELVDFEKDLLKTIKEIEEYEYVELDLSESVVDRYIELKELVEVYNAEMKAIKEEIMVEMTLDEVKYASSKLGRFSIVEKSTIEYSKKLINREKKIKAIIAKMKKEEVKNKVASEVPSTKYLTFKES